MLELQIIFNLSAITHYPLPITHFCLNHEFKRISRIPRILNIGNVGVADQVTIRDTGSILNNN